MNPESLHGRRFIHCLWDGQQDSLNDATKVSQVEDIMRLGWCREKILHCLLVHRHSSRDNHLNDWLKLTGKASEIDHTSTFINY